MKNGSKPLPTRCPLTCQPASSEVPPGGGGALRARPLRVLPEAGEPDAGHAAPPVAVRRRGDLGPRSARVGFLWENGASTAHG